MFLSQFDSETLLFCTLSMLLGASLPCLCLRIRRRRHPKSVRAGIPVPQHPAFDPASLIVFRHYVTGHRRPEAAKTAMPEQAEKDDTIFVPASEEKPAMQPWSGLVALPSIGEDGELTEPEAPDAIPPRPQLPPPPAGAEIRDAEIHAMLGEIEAGESIVTGDATAEERQAIAAFDIRTYA